MGEWRVTVPVEGMECGMCAATVARKLASTVGVARASVNVATGLAVAVLDDADANGVSVVQSLREAGFDCARTSLTLAVPGLRDEPGVGRVKSALLEAPGVLECSVNQLAETIDLEYLPGTATLKSFQYVLEGLGFDVADVVSNGVLDQRVVESISYAGPYLWRAGVAVVGWLVTLIAAMPLAVNVAHTPFGWLAGLLVEPMRAAVPTLFALDATILKILLPLVGLASVVVVGRHDLERAWKGFHDRVADRHTLVALAVGGGWVLATVGVFLQPGSTELMFSALNGALAIVMLGRWYEASALGRLTEQLLPLSEVLPDKAHVERDGNEAEIVLPEVGVGDRVVVKPNEVIPVDGIVISGESDVLETVLTGEELPVIKSRGHRVFAGTRNGRGTFAVEAVAVGRDTGAAQLLAAAATAHVGVTAPGRPLERSSRWLVPGVTALALVTFGVWFALGGSAGLTLGLAGLTSVALIAVPRSFVLAAPTAYLSAIHHAAGRGILVRDAADLDELAGIDTVLFDKSGTLTKGELMVSHVLGAERSDGATVSAMEILRLAAAVESQSRHAVGRAIVASAHQRNVEISPVERFVAMSGRGVRGVVGRFLVEVISVAHARNRNHDLGKLNRKVEKHVLQGRMPVVVVVNDTVQGLIILADEVRAVAKQTIAELQSMGLDVVMLSGDSKVSAGLAANEIGIDRVLAEVSPEHKGEEIARLQWDGRRVAAVGNGLGDADALAEARVGIAIGARGNIRAAASKVTLMNEDLTLVPAIIGLARETVRIARTNVNFVLVYHLLGIPLAAGVLYPLTGVVMGPTLAAILAVTCTTLLGSRGLRSGRPETATSE